MNSGNCNKAKCKTCIFGPTPLEISPWRRHEIILYLVSFESSHICHTTEKTCYGAMELQAKTLHAKGIIPEPTPESMLEVAQIFIK